MLHRRDLLAGLATSFALAACSKGGGANDGVLRVGSQRGGTKALMLASGALDGASYKIEWSEFPAAQNLLEAIGSGAVDVGLAGDAPFLFAYQAGSPIKAVAVQVTQQRTSGANSIVVPAASTIRDAAGLRGKKVATGRGSIGHYLLLRAIQSAHLQLSDVTIVFLSPSDSRAALQTGAVDAWSTWGPYVPAALAEGDRIVVDSRGLTQGTSFDVAYEGAIRDKRALLSDFTKREAKALEWAQANLDAYAKVLAQETGLPLPIAQATALRANRISASLDQSVIDRQQEVLDTFTKVGGVQANRPLKDAFVIGV